MRRGGHPAGENVARGTSGSAEVDRFVAGVDPPLREIVSALRATVRETAPELREQIVMGFRRTRSRASCVT